MLLDPSTARQLFGYPPGDNGLEWLFGPDLDEDFVEWLICHALRTGTVWTDDTMCVSQKEHND